jgi:sulfotransferase family protein
LTFAATAAELLASARAETGLDDFGDDSFREGLEVLVRSLRDEADLNAVGALALPALIGKHLTQRLQIEDWYRRHPEIAAEPVDRPLIGLGLPRTGSTALSFLLAEDPRARSLRRWEAGQPAPPPSTVAPPDPRIVQSQAEGELQQQLAPRLAALVPSTATGPEECQDLMALDFKSHYFQAFAHVPSYSEWLLDADLTPTYAYERRALQLLQWGSGPKPWRLKCPSHLLWLDHLDRVFPDARFVMTHRDPADVLVSVADVYAEVGRMFSDDVDLHYLGALNVQHWSIAMQRLLAFRTQARDARFYDIDFVAMQRDPIGEVRALYEWMGAEVSDEFEAGMRKWWSAHAEQRDANVHPEPQAFGLDLDDVRARFADYTRQMQHWTGKAAHRGR